MLHTDTFCFAIERYLRGVPDFINLSRYDLIAAILQTIIACAAMVMAVIYVTKRSGNRSSNVFFALLISSFALSVCPLILEHLGLPAKHDRLRFLPLWFTWTIGPSWFFYVKFSLFPSYKFRLTDLKHFLMPIIQWLTYIYVFVRYVPGQGPITWLGVRATTVEELIFLLSICGYIFMAYRYLRYRAKEIGDGRLRWDFWKVKLLRRSQRILVILMAFNFVFVAFNFATFQTLGTGLLHLRGFYASSSLTFSLMLVYLLRGVAYRQHFYPQVPPEEFQAADVKSVGVRLKTLIESNEGYKDPDLHKVRVARSIGLLPKALDELKPEYERWIRNLRFAEVSRLRKAGRSLRVAALEAGFASRRSALKAYEQRSK